MKNKHKSDLLKITHTTGNLADIADNVLLAKKSRFLKWLRKEGKHIFISNVPCLTEKEIRAIITRANK